MRHAYPFTAIVGQDDLRLALTLVAIDQSIGGVLAFGDRGTGKSTAVRALADLLPPIEAEDGTDDTGPRPTPVVDLPLGATEDRVVGALDLERALTRGEKAFEPGLLARADRGFLYIDE
ncbi:MAG: ATP-binding protein, partial [Pseudomonadota bacterium]